MGDEAKLDNATGKWDLQKGRCDIFVVWAPLSSLLLTCLFCGRHRTEKEQISILPLATALVTTLATLAALAVIAALAALAAVKG